ncbi:ORF166 [Staphylococcus phage X2]|uniref:ORF166 n=1 Tax=Staphylococcus phage X2 TaxID=2908152 RepID=Q4ZA89_9CAUD|nr:ORF166 [Staphylococcus phage X2]AAX92078.1 ORF166 [Staphylococcus phage X2]
MMQVSCIGTRVIRIRLILITYKDSTSKQRNYCLNVVSI